jgi:hypothetical protein
MKATWIGHKLVPFGSAACEECGNERLHHLHRIRFEDDTEKSVGCVCAASLCEGQKDDIDNAEKEMDRRDRRDKKWNALLESEVYLISGGTKKLSEL